MSCLTDTKGPLVPLVSHNCYFIPVARMWIITLQAPRTIIHFSEQSRRKDRVTPIWKSVHWLQLVTIPLRLLTHWKSHSICFPLAYTFNSVYRHDWRILHTACLYIPSLTTGSLFSWPFWTKQGCGPEWQRCNHYQLAPRNIVSKMKIRTQSLLNFIYHYGGKALRIHLLQ